MNQVFRTPGVHTNNPRKYHWHELNRCLAAGLDGLASPRLRLMRMLDKLHFVPHGEEEACRVHYRWQSHSQRYARADYPVPFREEEEPHGKGYLVRDCGRWPSHAIGTPAMLQRICRANGYHLPKAVTRQLKNTGVAYWSDRGLSDVLYALDLTDPLADHVNRVEVKNGAVKENCCDNPAEAGDVLCFYRWQRYDADKLESGVPYNMAYWYPRAFFTERARYVDALV